MRKFGVRLINPMPPEEFNSDSKKKERHIVTWSQEVSFHFTLDRLKFNVLIKYTCFVCWFFVLFNDMVFWLQEDDILRNQISVHGTDKYVSWFSNMGWFYFYSFT